MADPHESYAKEIRRFNALKERNVAEQIVWKAGVVRLAHAEFLRLIERAAGQRKTIAVDAVREIFRKRWPDEEVKE